MASRTWLRSCTRDGPDGCIHQGWKQNHYVKGIKTEGQRLKDPPSTQEQQNTSEHAHS